MELNKFYNCDCMEYMKTVPDKYFELAIVDPPYGIGKIESIHNEKMDKWNKEIPSPEYFKQLYRISKNQIIWGENYYGKDIIHKGRIVHYKDFTPFLKGQLCKSEGDIASQSFNNTVQVFTYQWCGNVQGGKINWDNKGEDARIHPTQKPIALYRWVLQNYAKLGDKIFDSHGGSGSLIIACIEEGYDYVVCEINKTYYDKTKKRIEEFKKRHQREIFKRKGGKIK